MKRFEVPRWHVYIRDWPRQASLALIFNVRLTAGELPFNYPKGSWSSSALHFAGCVTVKASRALVIFRHRHHNNSRPGCEHMEIAI